MNQRTRKNPGVGSADTISWTPPVDIYETDDAYYLTAELPGVERPDIKIEVTGSELSIRGERRFLPPCAEENYHRLETVRGRFRRTFTLPDKLNSEAITANLKDGVLEVRLPKAGSERSIAIRPGTPANR